MTGVPAEPAGKSAEADTSKSFSPSRLSAYENCPRRYRYRYVDRIHRDRRTGEAFLGTCVHAALEELYRAVARGRRPSAAEVLGTFEAEWDAGWSDEIVLRAGDSAESLKRLGLDCLRRYCEGHAPYEDGLAHEVERRVGFPVRAGDGEYSIAGFIDRLSRAPDGRVEIHDYKTGGRLPTQEEVDRDRQLAIYELAVRSSWPDTREVTLVWHYLRFARRLESKRTPEQRAALEAELAALIETIKADRAFEPKRSPLCDWCEYRDLCPLFRQPEALKALPPAERRRDEVLRLVDQYAALDAKRLELQDGVKRLERELLGLRGPLVEAADRLGASVLAGTEAEVSVGHKEEIRLPTRTHAPEAVEELESQLRPTSIWAEVSRLDGHLLVEGWRRKRWGGALGELVGALLARFGRTVRERPVRLRRKRAGDDEA